MDPGRSRPSGQVSSRVLAASMTSAPGPKRGFSEGALRYRPELAMFGPSGAMKGLLWTR
jgi:hypothetical protein